MIFFTISRTFLPLTSLKILHFISSFQILLYKYMIRTTHRIDCIFCKFLVSGNRWNLFFFFEVFLINFSTHHSFQVHIGHGHLMVDHATKLGTETLVVPLVVQGPAVINGHVIGFLLARVVIASAETIIITWPRQYLLLWIVLVLRLESCRRRVENGSIDENSRVELVVEEIWARIFKHWGSCCGGVHFCPWFFEIGATDTYTVLWRISAWSKVRILLKNCLIMA